MLYNRYRRMNLNLKVFINRLIDQSWIVGEEQINSILLSGKLEETHNEEQESKEESFASPIEIVKDEILQAAILQAADDNKISYTTVSSRLSHCKSTVK